MTQMHYEEACRIGPSLVAQYLASKPSNPVASFAEREAKKAKARVIWERWYWKHRPPTPMPQDGEVSMKEWMISESQRLGIKPNGVYMRLMRGWYPDLKIRRVNKRVAFVKI